MRIPHEIVSCRDDARRGRSVESSSDERCTISTRVKLAVRSLLPILCLAAASVFPQTQEQAISDTDRDVYRIYSLMLDHLTTSHGPDTGERLLIAATTSPGTPPEPCVRPPKDRQEDFQEVLADFASRKAKPRAIEARFSIRKPYSLASADDDKAFGSERGVDPHPKPPDPRFRGVTDLITLWDVYFNKGRTLALTGISTWCGSLCASYRWKVFEKTAPDKWEEREWISCFTIARAAGEESGYRANTRPSNASMAARIRSGTRTVLPAW
jgi:hypothetical protein